MNHPGSFLVTGVAEATEEERGGRRGPTDVPQPLLDQSTARIPRLALAMVVIVLVAWTVNITLRGVVVAEFRSLYQWGPIAVLLAASLGIYAGSRTRRVSPLGLLHLGLMYEVVVSYAIAATAYLEVFENVPAQYVTVDLVGVSAVALWMVFYTVLVPAPPRRALLALGLSGTAPVVVYTQQVAVGLAPALGGVNLFVIFVLPYAVTVVISFLAARVIYRLGEDVQRARELGSYRLEERLGQGGMGEVWRASHRMLARPAAIKLIHPEVVGSGTLRDIAASVRFEREAQATAQLQSPHTVELYDYGTSDDGSLYYVMELLDGIDLHRIVDRYGPLAPERVVHILMQVCDSLSEAHRRGLIHRDIKPANIFLCEHAFEPDFVKVLDFGLVKRHAAFEDDSDSALSQVGLTGTPSFMAPEVVLGGEPDARVDIYALGCVAYWLLTGHLVFEEPSISALLVAHAHKVPVPPSSRADQPIPEALDRVVLGCLAKDPDDRIPTADALKQRLAAVPVNREWTGERASTWWAEHRPAAPTA